MALSTSTPRRASSPSSRSSAASSPATAAARRRRRVSASQAGEPQVVPVPSTPPTTRKNPPRGAKRQRRGGEAVEDASSVEMASPGIPPEDLSGDESMRRSEPTSLAEANAMITESVANTDEIESKIAAKSDKVIADMETFKRAFAVQEKKTNDLLERLAKLHGVEQELEALQNEQAERSRQNTKLIEEALDRISSCAARVNSLERTSEATSIHLAAFQRECSQQMEVLLNKLEYLQGKETVRVDHDASMEGDLQANAEAIQQLREEITMFRARCDAIQPRQNASERVFLGRIDSFATRIQELRQEMVKQRQDIMLENEVSRGQLDMLLSEHMLHFRRVQADETKRLQQEMDELRSNMCELLKEIHVLKERTKYINPNSIVQARSRSRSRRRKRPGTDLAEGLDCTCFNGEDAHSFSLSNAQQRVRDRLCPAHGSNMPAMDVGYAVDDRNISGQYGHSPSSRGSSFLQQGAETGRSDLDPNASGPNSSRSSSAIQRMGSTREDEAANMREQEVSAERERQLLEQHRRFWISEGA